jgi:hypothetical protein
VFCTPSPPAGAAPAGESSHTASKGVDPVSGESAVVASARFTARAGVSAARRNRRSTLTDDPQRGQHATRGSSGARKTEMWHSAHVR